MNEIYWLQRLDNFTSCLEATMVLSIVLICVFGAVQLGSRTLYDDEELARAAKKTRKLKPKENFCMTCRHRIIESGPEAGFAEMYCKKHYWISHIARDTFYKRCAEIRGRKKFCKEWEQGGIKGFFQRLFKKYSK